MTHSRDTSKRPRNCSRLVRNAVAVGEEEGKDVLPGDAEQKAEKHCQMGVEWKEETVRGGMRKQP